MSFFVRFEVLGKPQPAGSKRAVPTNRNWGSVPGVRWRVVDANADADAWKQLVGLTGRAAMLKARLSPFTGALYMEMVFFRERPKSHLRAGGELSAEGHRTPHPATKPDVLKLARAVEDGLTDVVYDDDARIVDEVIRKRWGLEEKVVVTVVEL